MSSTIRSKRSLRGLAVAAVVGGAFAFAAPALANPCQNESNVFSLVGSSFTSGAHSQTLNGHTVTLDLVKHGTTSVDFSLTDDSPSTTWAAVRVWVNPALAGQKEYPVDATSDEYDNAYSPAVTSVSGLTAASGSVTGLKVCLQESGVDAARFLSLSASAAGRALTVRWRTASEIDVAGYNVYGYVHGKRMRLNRHVIASRSAGANSYAFRYRARGAAAPTHLSLQVVDLDGSTQWKSVSTR